MLDGTTRLTLDGVPVAQMSGLGTWNESSVVGVESVVKIDPEMRVATGEKGRGLPAPRCKWRA